MCVCVCDVIRFSKYFALPLENDQTCDFSRLSPEDMCWMRVFGELKYIMLEVKDASLMQF